MRKAKSGKFDEYTRIISSERPDSSSRGSLPIALEAASDRSRILYSSAFRRLQQKTQVFSLSKNAAVRSRLTHSLEVSDVGRLIATKLAEGFLKPLGSELLTAITTMVETGCLMHDIGNPPFGHFAEVVVQRWFETNWADLHSLSTGVTSEAKSPGITKIAEDFLRFDGNPQGIRITTRLQGRTNRERCNHGMNLTLSQLLTGLKYLTSTSELNDPTKKAGFFESERDRIEYARERLGIHPQRRFPLAYIVEASDDISYSLSDIEDGIEHRILSPTDFFTQVTEFTKDWQRVLAIPSGEVNVSNPNRDDFFVFKTYFTRSLVHSAARRFEERHESIVDGRLSGLFLETDEEWALLEGIKGIAGRHLYSSLEVELPLRVGLEVVQGILEHFGALLSLDRGTFDELMEARKSGNRKRVRKTKKDPELLLYDMLPQTYIDVYEFERINPRDGVSAQDWEWFCRAHLVLDFLCGMTDDFALRTYHAVAGIAYDT